MKKKEIELIDNFRQNVKRIRLCCQRIENRRYEETSMIRAMGFMMQETIQDMFLNIDKYTEWLLKDSDKRVKKLKI